MGPRVLSVKVIDILGFQIFCSCALRILLDTKGYFGVLHSPLVGPGFPEHIYDILALQTPGHCAL
ncbi:Hypothetical protein FKW44_022852, partial [Caligus rogercresseyi]